jgi:mannose-6-phosphate isomerase
LFALAWARRLLGDVVDVALAEGLLCHLETQLRRPSGDGFLCAKPQSDRFTRQNPHMHLFEAALELEDAFGSRPAGALADRLHGLFRDRMIFEAAKALPELHDENWTPIETPEAVFEPGHHFEWMWLLNRYSARSGKDVRALVGLLSERAWAEGLDQHGAAIESVEIGTGRRLESRRCWGSCEGLKAAATDFAVGRDRLAARDRATGFARSLGHAFLGRPFRAGWVDRIDAKGLPLVDFVPASTLYHLTSAIVEGDRVFGDDRA